MDGCGRCMDNVFIERLWRSLKHEAVYRHELADGLEARQVIGAWLAFYNLERPHSSHQGQDACLRLPRREPGYDVQRSAPGRVEFSADSAVFHSPGGCGELLHQLLLGYFEGLDSERGIAWRAHDSLGTRRFLGLGVTESAPDHSTISRTRRQTDVETHRRVFRRFSAVWRNRVWCRAKRQAWMRRLWRRTLRYGASCVATRARTTRSSCGVWRRLRAWPRPKRAELARFDRKRKKKLSNEESENPHDPDTQVTKMKDGRAHLACKAEQAVDLECGTILGVPVHGSAKGDGVTLRDTGRDLRAGGVGSRRLGGCICAGAATRSSASTFRPAASTSPS